MKKTKKRIIVGVTGEFGVGKSTATSFFPKKTWEIVDVDHLGHRLLLKENIKKEIVRVFGKNVLKKNAIDRRKLGSLVFSNQKKTSSFK